MGRRSCRKGKACSSTCINKDAKCRKELPKNISSSVSRFKKLGHIAEHVGINVLAWKTGKVIGPLISKSLEQTYGIPSEVSLAASESMVQAITAVSLNSKSIKTAQDLVKSLIVEGSAAMLGKQAHSGVEDFLSSTDGKEILKEALPLLAGKFTGIGVAVTGSRVPSLSKIAEIVVSRSRADIEKIQKMVGVSPFDASETREMKELSNFLADLTVITMILSATEVT